MNEKILKKYYIFSAALVLVVSIYPLYMGVRVISDMIRQGTVLGADYPKYMIPYTPISLAVVSGVLLMPILIKRAGRFALIAASCISIGIFFLSELLLESKVIVTMQSVLRNWLRCTSYISYELYEAHRWHVADVLIGEYGPLFKIHLYIFSAILILSFLSCFYGFGQMIKNNNRSKMKVLILQAISSVLFLGMFILACHSAFFITMIYTMKSEVELKSILSYFTPIFYRADNLIATPVSAVLISIFFVVFCVTVGIYAVSFLVGRKKWVRSAVASGVSMAAILILYIGEIIYAETAGIELTLVNIAGIFILVGIAGILGGAVNRISRGDKEGVE